MHRRYFLAAAAALAARFGLGGPAPVHAATAPDWESVTLKSALEQRASGRSFSSQGIEEALLLEMLWAAFGVNRPQSGKRTAPSSWNKQEIDIYVAQQSGMRRFDAATSALVPFKGVDLRTLTGKQGFVADAAVSLVFVADLNKLDNHSKDTVLPTAWADTAFISQNVYLFCAAAGLTTVVRSYVDRPALAKAMGLEENMAITLAQSVGYPG